MAKTIVNPAIQKLRKIIVITFAALLMAANINTFVEAGGLYPGGATGITVLIRRVAELWFNVELPYTFVIILLNAIPIYIGYRYIGKKFTIYSVYMIIMTGVFSDILPTYAITYDTLLVSIFGGIINGLAISICLIKGATSGGTDFIAIFLSDRKGMDSWNFILGINVVILGTAGFLFGWDKALYSIIFQYASTQVLHTLYTRYQKETLFIVTNKPEEICVIISD
ncbi:MAG: YitT family protein, partial [Lachnospiraceae bacterium]|nr:YitT family protein [Lachnospiraceae bacterium]